jgi:adenine-specific DNA methylase
MKIRHIITIAIIAATLTGCGTPYRAQLQQAIQEGNVAIWDCENKRKSGELKTYEESVQCSNPRYINAYQKVGFPYMDLINLMASKALEVAEREDKKEITEAQAQLELAQFNTQINSEENRRDAGQQQLASQRATAAAAMFSSMPRYQAPAPASLAPLPAPRPIVNTNCMATGQYLNCTSN